MLIDNLHVSIGSADIVGPKRCAQSDKAWQIAINIERVQNDKVI